MSVQHKEEAAEITLSSIKRNLENVFVEKFLRFTKSLAVLNPDLILAIYHKIVISYFAEYHSSAKDVTEQVLAIRENIIRYPALQGIASSQGSCEVQDTILPQRQSWQAED